jgi:spore coat polysaccharide biosynthesis protein SpsF
MQKIVAILQARLDSCRLPNKVILPLKGKKDAIDIILTKLKKIKFINEIYLATGNYKKNKIFEKKIKKFNINFFFGDNENVRSRFIKIIKISKADIGIRLTADNPFTEMKYLKYLTKYLISNKNCNYVKFDERTLPFGSGVEVFRSKAFMKYLNINSSKEALEHVLLHLKKFKKRYKVLKVPKKLSVLPVRVTLDYKEDLKFLRYALSKTKRNSIFELNKFFNNNYFN